MRTRKEKVSKIPARVRRAAFFTVELPLVLSALFFTALWGWEQRARKRSSSITSSPLRQGWASASFGMLFLALLMLFLAPVALAPVLVPLLIMGACLGVIVSIANMAKEL